MKAHATITRVLLQAMRACRLYDASFEASLKEARRQFNQEVSEAALNPPTK